MNQKPRAARTAVPLLDVVEQNRPLRAEILEAISQVIDSGRFLHGPDCRQLEAAMAERCGVSHAVSCASGSDALLLSMMALGIGRGDEVILPSFTFFATASCISRLGARPVFVEIDPVSFNIDPNCVADAITPATRAVIPVHLFGQCADMPALLELGHRHGIAVVEDAAQAIGARLQDRPAGGWGDLACFSFYPTKNLGGMGDGGMITTSNSHLAQRLRLLAAHGMEPRYYHQEVGINSRLDSIQAAVLNVKIRRLDQWSAARQSNADRFREMFTAAGLDEQLILPQVGPHQRHVWNQYTIRVPNNQRDEMRQFLSAAQIGSEIYYPVPLHRQACFADLERADVSLPVTEQIADEVLSLPISPELTEQQQEAVVDRIACYYQQANRHAA